MSTKYEIKKDDSFFSVFKQGKVVDSFLIDSDESGFMVLDKNSRLYLKNKQGQDSFETTKEAEDMLNERNG